MMASDMVIGADQATLHDREKAFNPIGANDAARVFALAMVDLG